MKAKKLFAIGMLNLSLVGSVFASTLNSSWHTLPEEKGYSESADKAGSNDNLESIDAFLDTYTSTHHEVLEEQAQFSTEKSSGWKVKRVRTWLGLGASGKIGPVGFGGSKTVKIDWEPKKKNKANEVEEENYSDIVLNEDSTESDVNAQLEPVIKNLVKSGKVKNEAELRRNLRAKAAEFHEYSKGMYTYGDYVWYAKKLRLDLSISASGKVKTFVVKVGGDVRVRLEWVRLKTKSESDKANARKSFIAKSTSSLLNSLAQDFTAATVKTTGKYGFHLSEIKVCLSMSASGKVVVASVKGGINPCVYFGRHRTAAADKANLEIDKKATFPLSVENSDGVFDYANKNKIAYEKGNKKSVFKVNRKKFRRGIKKAYKFGMKFAKKVTKKRYKRSSWGIKAVKPGYKLSVSGSVGVAKLSASPEIELVFKNLAM